MEAFVLAHAVGRRRERMETTAMEGSRQTMPIWEFRTGSRVPAHARGRSQGGSRSEGRLGRGDFCLRRMTVGGA